MKSWRASWGSGLDGDDRKKCVLAGPEPLDLLDVVVGMVVLVTVIVIVIIRHASALPTTACASSMMRSRCSSPRKLSA